MRTRSRVCFGRDTFDGLCVGDSLKVRPSDGPPRGDCCAAWGGDDDKREAVDEASGRSSTSSLQGPRDAVAVPRRHCVNTSMHHPSPPRLFQVGGARGQYIYSLEPVGAQMSQPNLFSVTTQRKCRHNQTSISQSGLWSRIRMSPPEHTVSPTEPPLRIPMRLSDLALRVLCSSRTSTWST